MASMIIYNLYLLTLNVIIFKYTYSRASVIRGKVIYKRKGILGVRVTAIDQMNLGMTRKFSFLSI